MALTGLAIQKLLPKTNCKECGSNTCLAFAMKLAANKAELSLCPYASDEAKRVLGAASEPPVKTLSLGSNKKPTIGGETVLYRHEKTFVNQTALGINLDDTLPDTEIDDLLQKIKGYSLVRVGETLTIDLVSITNRQPERSRFISVAKRAREKTGLPIIIHSENNAKEVLNEAAKTMSGTGSVIASALPHTAAELADTAKKYGHALAVTAPTLDEIVSTTTSLRGSGFTDIILNFSTSSLAEKFQVNTLSRSAALRSSFKALGYPSIAFIKASNNLDTAVDAVTEIAKYGGIAVLPAFNPALLSTLMTLRMNIYTDPQKPIQVEPRLYPVGDPGPDSPVFVTTNFSLTYFIVSGEIENTGISAWLVVPECEGMSVLTAWAAGKFSGTSIAKFVKESKLEEKIITREMVIPGHVSQISGELEEGLPGWKVLVGPQEAGDLESFVKARNW
jgi:acetyl-CoA decarbonylase/synthase complex subunit gamma